MAIFAFSNLQQYRWKWLLLSVVVTTSSIWGFGFLLSSNGSDQANQNSASSASSGSENSSQQPPDAGPNIKLDSIKPKKLQTISPKKTNKQLFSARAGERLQKEISSRQNSVQVPFLQKQDGSAGSSNRFAQANYQQHPNAGVIHPQYQQSYPSQRPIDPNRFRPVAQSMAPVTQNGLAETASSQGNGNYTQPRAENGGDYFANSSVQPELNQNLPGADRFVQPSGYYSDQSANQLENQYSGQGQVNQFRQTGGQFPYGRQEREAIPGRERIQNSPAWRQDFTIRRSNLSRQPLPLISIASNDPAGISGNRADPNSSKPNGQYQKKELPGGAGSTNFQLAAQPKASDHWESRPPISAEGGYLAPYSKHDFAPDPIGIEYYDAHAQQQIYEGKTLNANQRPMLELFKPWYQLGQLPKAKLWLGRHNPVVPQFLLYGDFRTAVASNTQNGNNSSVWAYRLNLDFDFRLTSTERFHWFMGPLDRGGQFTRFVRDNDDLKFISEFDPDIDFGYLEGDLGALWGGFSKTSLPFDLPFAIGNMPLLFQNGVWLEDAFVGAAFTIPAKNSPTLDISNYDITFLFGYDKINSPAFGNDDNAAKLYGIATFIEAAGGYFEIDYAFLEDRTNFNRSYHNSSIAFTRRYGRFVSNSIRVINNAGQNPNGIDQTADGTAILFENSLITSNPITFIPYFNTFVGFDTPQSAARAGGSGGILRNTGILFESDGLTGFPTLDDRAQNTFGGAVGLNILAKDLSQQLIVEAAMVQPFNGKQSSAPGEQFGLGARYQLPLSNAIILRTDAMVGFTDGRADRHGVRVELRHKW